MSFDVPDLDPSSLSDEELDLLDAQLRVLRDRVAAVRFRRLKAREISAETFASFEARLRENVDSETMAAFERPGPRRRSFDETPLAPPPAHVVANVAFRMVLDGFSEEVTAEATVKMALEAGMERNAAIAACAEGIDRARKTRRRADA